MLFRLSLLASVTAAQGTIQFMAIKSNKSPSATTNTGPASDIPADNVVSSGVGTAPRPTTKRTITMTYSGPPTITVYQTTRLTVTLSQTPVAAAAQPEKNAVDLTADGLIPAQEHGSDDSPSMYILDWYNSMNAIASMAMSSMTLPRGMSSMTQRANGIDKMSAIASTALASMTIPKTASYSNKMPIVLTTTMTMTTTIYKDVTTTVDAPAAGTGTQIQTIQVRDLTELTGRYAIL
jgi:hypothetical protein